MYITTEILIEALQNLIEYSEETYDIEMFTRVKSDLYNLMRIGSISEYTYLRAKEVLLTCLPCNTWEM
jgi:hypothetical protein